MSSPRLALLGSVLALASCSYDWALGPRLSDESGRAPSEDSGVDAPPSAGDDAASNGPSTGDGSVPKGPEGASSCNTVLSELVEAREAARRCTSSTTACTTELEDECGCAYVVGQADSVATASYRAAIAEAKRLQCVPPWCSGVCRKPSRGLCIVADGGGTACHE